MLGTLVYAQLFDYNYYAYITHLSNMYSANYVVEFRNPTTYNIYVYHYP